MEQGKEYDVVVVGGGLAGLSAAFRLKQRSPKLKVVILEAKERVGGRTLTIEAEGQDGVKDWFDLGGHWVSDSQKDIMELLHHFQISYYPQNVTGTKILQVGDGSIRTYESDIPSLGSWIALIQLQFFITKVENLAKKFDVNDPFAADPDLAKYYDSMTAASFLHAHYAHQSVYQIFNAGILAVMGCDITQVSMLFLLTYSNAAGGLQKLLLVENQSAQQYKVKGGTQQICQKLLDYIGTKQLVLNSRVILVDQSGTKTVIKCSNGEEYICKQVICTLPVGQMTKMEFRPKLSQSKQVLSRQMRMGNLSKVYLFYKTDFWNKKGFSGEVVCYRGPFSPDDEIEQPVCVVYDATTSKGVAVLKGFFGGQTCDYWMDQPLERRKEAVLKQMVSYFGEEARNPINYIEKTWTTEDSIEGGPVEYLPPGFMHHFNGIRKSEGRIHFAGTATATDWTGYLSGAAQSGFRTASEVLREMNPDQMTEKDKDYLTAKRPNRENPSMIGRIPTGVWIFASLALIYAIMLRCCNSWSG